MPVGTHVTLAGASIGRADITLEPQDAALHVIDIAISAAARGRGIGGAIIGALTDAAADLGVSRCTLSVLAGNVPARRFYERQGFLPVGGDVHLQMVKALR